MSEVAATTPFEIIGERQGVQAVVDRFYDLMDQEPAYAALRALHGADLAPMRQSLTGFLAGWLGGPRDWFAARPGACIMSLHARAGVTPETARQWTEAMARALEDCGVDPALRQRMNDAFGRLAMGMA
ncbi:group II truncated hemoglobin [Phenylobacterium montanum]|uniref:Group II truncated hemoglobin n=1 Tax=Phenylobacterium montanum TaxID=2823693 RepID=A0A975ITQ2_9CAUL|nr:group II truncated hemoglobin [Caulobacter sp. S6]QUD87003.1 group II truncated hemoglobin [Caulobacter sp. S6]